MHTLSSVRKRLWSVVAVTVLLASLATVPGAFAHGGADGLWCTHGVLAGTTRTFTLTTRTGYILTPDANVVYMWGLSEGASPFQHPSPVLCANEGETITIIVNNTLREDISLIFPGQDSVLANGAPSQPQFDGGGVLTSLTNVAPASGGSVTYSFVATHPGTFVYESGTNPDVQVPLGLFGALVVRPSAGQYFVYNDSALPAGQNSEFNHGRLDDMGDVVASGENLVLQSEVDPALSQAVERYQEQGLAFNYNMNNYHPRYWLMNGRGLPDTIAPNNASWLPSQPYGALAVTEPNDEMYWSQDGAGNWQWVSNPSPANPLYYLERFLNVSSQPLPFHPHGKNAIVIGRDAQPVRGSLGEDLSYERFALVAGPGQTFDALFHWHNREAYTSTASLPSQFALPVADPGWQNLVYGPHYSGSPYLGETGPMPPGFTTHNQCGEFYIIAHNHALFQLTSWGLPMTGPGTFLRVDPPGGCPPMVMP